MRRHGIVLLAAVAVALVVAAPAGAVTVGSATPVGDGPAIGATTYVQTADPPGGPSYAVPAGGGVLTGWKVRVRANSGVSATFKLKVVRPAAGGQFTLVGETALTIVGAIAFVDATAAARISVQAGDRLAAQP